VQYEGAVTAERAALDERTGSTERAEWIEGAVSKERVNTMKAANDAGSLDAWQAKRKRRLHKPRVSRSRREDRTLHGITFASKAEMVRYQELHALQVAGEVLWFIRNPGWDVLGVKVYADFLIVWRCEKSIALSGSVRVTVEDVKGKGGNPEHRRRFERNRKQVQEAWGVAIEEVIR